jgi:tetratricopeptide (TPR) repeat protein
MPGILADIPVPDMPPPSASLVEMPKVEVSSQAALAIAQEYERELREKLRATEEEAQQTFWAKHWLKVAIAAVLLVALAVGGWAYQQVRSKNQNRTLNDELVRARQLLLLDTREGYTEALRTLDHALDMDASSVEAQALIAYTHALMFEELGHEPNQRDQASLGLALAGVREKFPGLSLVTDYLVAGDDTQTALRKEVLSSSLDEAEVQTLAGQLLLMQGNFKGAVDKLTKALENQPNTVRAWIILASYYRTHEDCDNALKMYTGIPLKMAPEHPERVIGAAECRLALSRDVDVSRVELEKLSPEGLQPDQRVRRALALARAYGQSGDASKAVAVLTEEGKLAPTRTFDFQLALGDALRRSGDWEGAQRAAEVALRSKPSSDEAKELVGRLLIGRDREHEVITRFPNDDGRRIRLVRAAALVRLGEWKQARAELQKTQVGGKFSTEAVVYLASIDAAEGQVERAQSVLERVLASTKRARGEVQLALGNLYWKKGLTDKARAQFEEAAKDPEDYEGPCSLGRMLLSVGLPEAALEPLTLAIQRNGFHGEARAALAEALLQVGKPADALTQLEAWQKDNPSSPTLKRDLAITFLQLGPTRWKDADSASAWAVKLAPKDVAAYRVRAQVLFAHGDVKGGFAALEHANKLNPKDGETFCAIGQAFFGRGNIVNAQKAFDAAHRENPALACSRLGSVLLKPVAARGVLSDLKALAEPTHPVWDRAMAEAARARVLLSANNSKDARVAADEALKLAPFSAEAQLASALVSARTREDGKAKAAFDLATQLAPGDARIHLAYADAVVRSDPARAMNEYQQFLKWEDHSADAPRVKKALPALKKHSGAH